MNLLVQSPKTEHVTLVVVVVAFLFIGVAYSVVTPIFESPDERVHYNYIRYLVNERRLPVVSEIYEAHHPPLYYLVGAVATSWIPEDAYSEFLNQRRNPYWRYLMTPRYRDNRNRFLHTKAEAFPYQGTSLGIHIVRLLSLFMGAGTVTATWLVASELSPDSGALPLVASALVAFNPMFIFISTSVNNASLLNLLSALVLLISVRVAHSGVTRENCIALGVFLGLGLITKMWAFYLILPVGLSLLWATHRSRSWRTLLQAGGGIAVLVLLITGWWFIRNVRVYGDPMGFSATSSHLGFRARPLTWTETLQAMGTLVHRSFWALFGYIAVPISSAFYKCLGVMEILGIAGFTWFLSQEWRRREDGCLRDMLPKLSVLALMLLTVVTGSLMIVRVSSDGVQGRFLFPALAPFGTLIGLGLLAWWPSRWKRAVAWAIAGSMMAFAIVCLLVYLVPAYMPRVYRTYDREQISQRVNWIFGDDVRLLGYGLKRSEVAPGETLNVTLYWEAMNDVRDLYLVSVQLFGRDGVRIGQRDTHPCLGKCPTDQWREGDVIVETIPVPIGREAKSPSQVHVWAVMHDRDGGLPARDAQGNPLGTPSIARIRLVDSATAQPTRPEWSTDFRLDNATELVGYDLPEVRAGAECSLTLTLHWAASGQPQHDYTVFVHLVDGAGNLIGQSDRQPVDGNFPTSLWRSGDYITDTHCISMTSDSLSGVHHLVTGMYRLETMERVSVRNSEGQLLPDDVIPLDTITIRRE